MPNERVKAYFVRSVWHVVDVRLELKFRETLPTVHVGVRRVDIESKVLFQGCQACSSLLDENEQ
jgi:hypothetical protein